MLPLIFEIFETDMLHVAGNLTNIAALHPKHRSHLA
jgi:hypothetical protein